MSGEKGQFGQRGGACLCFLCKDSPVVRARHCVLNSNGSVQEPACLEVAAWEVLAAISRAPARGLPRNQEPWKLSGPCRWGRQPFSAIARVKHFIPPVHTRLLCLAARKFRYLFFKYLSFVATKYCPFNSRWLYPCNRSRLALIFMCVW